MVLKPEQKVHLQTDHLPTKFDAVVRSSSPDSCTVNVFGAPADMFAPGDQLAIEFVQWEDALYILRGQVKEVQVSQEAGDSCCLHFTIENAGRIQRRRAERMTVRIPAEYTPLQGKPFEKDMPKGLIINISHTGVLLSVENPLKVGEELLLMFDVPLNREKVSIGTTGKVVREHGKGNSKGSSKGFAYSYGVHFKKPERLLAV